MLTSSRKIQVIFVDLYQFFNFEQFAWGSEPAFISTSSICQYPTTYDSDVWYY